MKILVVTTSFPTANEEMQLGGSFVLTECLAYEKAGADVTVVTPGVYGVPAKEVFGDNIQVHRFTYFLPRKLQRVKTSGLALYHRMGLFFYFQLPFFLLFFMLKTLLLGKRVDIIHCNWTLSALVALPLRWLYKVPIVLTVRGSDIRSIPKFINTFIINNIEGMIDCFGPYPEVLEIKRMFPANYITLPVIVKEPSRVDSEFTGTPHAEEGKYVIVYIGRFDPTKEKLGFGFFTLLEAVHLISADQPLKCIYVGDGSLMKDLVKRTLELDLKEKVEFAGYQENIYKYIEYADLVVGGSALNGVSEEASLMGKPQLLPNIEMWQKNLWRDRGNCLLYDTGSPESMADAIRFAMLHPEEMKKITLQVHKLSKRYLATGKEGGKIYLKAFEQLIEGNKGVRWK